MANITIQTTTGPLTIDTAVRLPSALVSRLVAIFETQRNIANLADSRYVEKLGSDSN